MGWTRRLHGCARGLGTGPHSVRLRRGGLPPCEARPLRQHRGARALLFDPPSSCLMRASRTSKTNRQLGRALPIRFDPPFSRTAGVDSHGSSLNARWRLCRSSKFHDSACHDDVRTAFGDAWVARKTGCGKGDPKTGPCSSSTRIRRSVSCHQAITGATSRVALVAFLTGAASTQKQASVGWGSRTGV